MKTLKTEEVDGRRFKDIEDARRSIAVFIEIVYNAERLHSALGYCSPLEFETNFALAKSR
jgi:transposase InsO family protein